MPYDLKNSRAGQIAQLEKSNLNSSPGTHTVEGEPTSLSSDLCTSEAQMQPHTHACAYTIKHSIGVRKKCDSSNSRLAMLSTLKLLLKGPIVVLLSSDSLP